MRHFKDEVLKADEVSRWLRIPKSIIYKLCLEGQIPGTKIGRHWRFDRRILRFGLRIESKMETRSLADDNLPFIWGFSGGKQKMINPVRKPTGNWKSKR